MGARRASHGEQFHRTRFVRRPALGAQNPRRPHPRKPGTPATTRPAPPRIQATTIRPPRSPPLGVALQAMGWVARGAAHRSAGHCDSLAPAGLPRFWTWKSRRGRTGRPPVASELANLVRTMALANPLWGAPRIHGELLKLGFDISQRSVARLMPRRPKPPSQTWRTFLQ